MNNKFLDLYPELRDPLVGDLVELLSVQPFWVHQQYYSIGDIGRIIYISIITGTNKTFYFITFDIPENTNKETHGNICLSKTDFKVIQHNESE